MTKLSITLRVLTLILGAVTIVLGVNEATKDVLDQIGSNYWLAYSAIISGIVIIALVVIFSRLPKT